MDDRRHEPRSRAFKSGTISVGAGCVECLIRNFSKAGACLEIKGNTTAVPNDFKLIIKPESLFRTCKVIWRNRDRIGVVFV